MTYLSEKDYVYFYFKKLILVLGLCAYMEESLFLFVLKVVFIASNLKTSEFISFFCNALVLVGSDTSFDSFFRKGRKHIEK